MKEKLYHFGDYIDGRQFAYHSLLLSSLSEADIYLTQEDKQRPGLAIVITGVPMPSGCRLS